MLTPPFQLKPERCGLVASTL